MAPVPTAVFAPAIVAEAKALAPAPTAVLAPAIVEYMLLNIFACVYAAIDIIFAPAIVAEAKALAPVPTVAA